MGYWGADHWRENAAELHLRSTGQCVLYDMNQPPLLITEGCGLGVRYYQLRKLSKSRGLVPLSPTNVLR